METLLRQLRQLPAHLAALPAGLKLVLVAGALALIAVATATAIAGAENWQYAFTNLSSEDSAEAATALKAAQVPFRLEAGGTALAVPASKVYDARLLLASTGLPRGAGVGFELFDRGDLGVSEFTQRVNLRRATEGELARTVGRLAQVRSARVHLTLPERTLFRDEDRKPSASVVVNLQPGRVLEERELSGIRHLVASAVPGLSPGGVTVVDGRGNVLSTDAPWGEAQAFQKKLERDLEQRILDLLQQAAGPGAVVARVSAALDASEISTNAEAVDPDSTALRSERRLSQTQSQDATAQSGIAGAAANQPLSPPPAAAGQVNRGASSLQDEIRNYDVTRTTTTTTVRMPRIKRLSVAVLVDGVQGKARPQEELARLGELAKRAVGFDPARGDEMDISSAPFARSEEAPAPAPTAVPAALPRPSLQTLGGGLLALLVLFAAAWTLLRRRPGTPSALPTLTPGSRVAEIEAALAGGYPALAPGGASTANDPALRLRDRARDLAARDPSRAAHILRAWISTDPAQRSDHA